MNKVYQYEITAKMVFQVWAIRTYLHKRVYNFMYLLTKFLAIYIIFVVGTDSVFFTLYNVFIFFFFEIVMIYRYFKIKKNIEIVYGDNKTATVELKEEEIVFSTKNASKAIPLNEITKVKETRWFIFVYKQKLVVGTFYKRMMSKEELEGVTAYFLEQSKANRLILQR